MEIQVLMSLLTLILTPLLAGLVVRFQLSKEHTFVTEQRCLAEEQRRLDIRIALQKDIVALLNKWFGTKELLHREEIRAAFYVSARELLGESGGPLMGDVTARVRELVREELEVRGRLRAALVQARYFFGEDVAGAGDALVAGGETAGGAIPPMGPIVDAARDFLSGSEGSPDVAMSRLNNELFGKAGEDLPRDEATRLIAEMSSRIAEEVGMLP